MRLVPVALALTLAVGCDPDKGGDEGNGSVDSGSWASDNGNGADSGSEGGGDTSSPTDSGSGGDTSSPTDSGSGGDTSSPTDSGGDTSSPADSGGDTSSPTDSGGDTSSPTDSGGDTSSPTDSGGDTSSPTDSGDSGDSADTGDSGGSEGGGIFDDADGDGYSELLDCDDSDPDIHPGAEDVCDAVDNDCDSLIDEDAATSTWYADADEDGHGDAGSSVEACEAPAGSVSDGTDCDDSDGAVHPGATEVCDGADNDCDSSVDEGVEPATWYTDADEDGYGDASSSVEACEAPAGTVSDASDCDDSDGDVNPGASEVCDDSDNDCDALIDDRDGSLDLSSATTWYRDADSDLYGDPLVSTQACDRPTGYRVNRRDCDDTRADISPADPEICDGLDNDCDSLIDDADSSLDLSTTTEWTTDADGDGYGDDSTAVQACEAPPSGVTEGGDCDDLDSAVSPGAAEVCNAADDDCDGVADSDAACGCHVEYYDGDYSHPYLFCETLSAWTTAQTSCDAVGYHMLTIDDTAENTWADDTADLYSSGKWWMGYNDRDSEGTWVWEDGSSSTYTAWAPGEPNDAGGEDCGQLNRFHPEYTWNDEPCTSTFRYVCEAW